MLCVSLQIALSLNCRLLSLNQLIKYSSVSLAGKYHLEPIFAFGNNGSWKKCSCIVFQLRQVLLINSFESQKTNSSFNSSNFLSIASSYISLIAASST